MDDIWMIYDFVHILKVGHLKKLINICSDMPASLSCENTRINLIWAKNWKYLLLSLCISVLTNSFDF